MKWFTPIALSMLVFSLTGCNKGNSKKEEVVSKRYIHKYGYDVSKEEWESADYPGQVITTLRNGVTISATYEDGILSGPTTYTYAHSGTRQAVELYEHGNLIKKVSYSIRGIPTQEELFISPTNIKTTKWYPSGTPMSVEETMNGEILEGQYLSLSNETEARIQKGSGTRILRDEEGNLLEKETIQNGYPILRETYYESGSPHEQIPLSGGVLHGELKVFAKTGEPVSIQKYSMGVMHGLATYFQNGYRYLEMPYVEGMKEGIERHYIDGENLVEETEWLEDKKHGTSTVYCDGIAHTKWFYNGEKVSKEKYNYLLDRERTIAIMNERSKSKTYLD